MTAPLPPHSLVIGLEVHVQLRTRRKLFSDCAVRAGAEPNTRVGPQCLGLPGTLPVLDGEALDQALRVALALGADVASVSRFDRKSYVYADLPKGYQITQFEHPLCTGGRVEFEGPAGATTVRIARAHLEEDAGRLQHRADGALVDYDRAGVPLLEIVTEPDLQSADDAVAFLRELRDILRHVGASHADMEKGQFRCEPNVNVEVERDGAGAGRTCTPIAELKNLNSFAAVRGAIEYERERQVRELLAGGPVGPRPGTTRGWDDRTRTTFLQRTKEEAADYRYFPEPDLPPVTCAQRRAAELEPTLPELPLARRRRWIAALGVAREDAADLVRAPAVASWFERVAKGCDPASAARWVRNDVLREARARGVSIDELALSPEALADLIRAVAAGNVPADAARKQVLPVLCDTGRDAADVIESLGLSRASGEDLERLVREVVAERPELLEAARGGRQQVLEVLVGEVMRRSRGTADAVAVRRRLRQAAGCD